jgi:hypothetical protein
VAFKTYKQAFFTPQKNISRSAEGFLLCKKASPGPAKVFYSAKKRLPVRQRFFTPQKNVSRSGGGFLLRKKTSPDPAKVFYSAKKRLPIRRRFFTLQKKSILQK